MVESNKKDFSLTIENLKTGEKNFYQRVDENSQYELESGRYRVSAQYNSQQVTRIIRVSGNSDELYFYGEFD